MKGETTMKMNMMMVIGTAAIAGMLCGCKTEELPEPPREYVNVPIQYVAGAIPAGCQEKVMSNPNLRAYAIGRYVDPGLRVMHEQHSVYRVEQMPAWNLIPQPDADPVLRAQKMRQERYADAATGQIERATAEVRSTQRMVNSLIEGQALQKEQAAELVSSLEAMKKRYGVLSENILRTSEFARKLEEEVKKLKGENEMLRLQLRNNNRPAIHPSEVQP